MKRDEYLQAKIGDIVSINGNTMRSGFKAIIINFLNDRSNVLDGYWGGHIQVRFEDGLERMYSHRSLRILAKDTKFEANMVINIPKAQYDDMQKRIIDLGVYDEQQRSLIQKLDKDGLALMYSITDAITNDTHKYPDGGVFRLPHEVVKKMNEFIKLLNETYDKYPLADDEMCRCGHPASKHYDVSHGCLVDGCRCMDYVEVENG